MTDADFAISIANEQEPGAYDEVCGGTFANRGTAVVLEIDGSGGIELQLTEVRGHPHDLNFFRAFGIEPTERRILVLKSAVHFRAAFEPVEAPGISSPDLHGFPYQRLRRPVYPLDPDVQWSPEDSPLP